MQRIAPAARLGTQRHLERDTLGDYLIEIGEQLGLKFHPWQRALSDVSMELIPRADPQGEQSSYRLNHSYVGALVGRQSGKTMWAVSRIVAQALLPGNIEIADRVGVSNFKPQHIAYTAQSRTVAVMKWLEHVEIIERSSMKWDIQKIIRATGRELLTFNNGSTYRPITPNRTNARGLTLDLVIIDEALTHELWLLSVLRPTMAQRDAAEYCMGAQFIVISNAGDEDSELLNRMQELGIESLNDPNSRRCWMEWSMEPGADPLSEQTWLDTMPTLGLPNGIEVEFLKLEAETIRLDQFMREYLCHRIPKSREQLIPTDIWMEQYRTDIMIPPDVTLGLDITPDRQRASLVACGSVGNYLPVEVVESRESLEWVLDRCIEIANRWSAPIVIDSGGPAASLIAPLESARVTVIPIAAREVTIAAAMFYDNVMAKRVVHMNDFRLNDAVIGASKRAVGERWAFDRRGHVDISPLAAASFALWAIETNQAQSPGIY